jgi:acetyl esterase
VVTVPVDPAAQTVLDILHAPGVPPLDELPVPDARAAYDQLAGFSGEPAEVARTEDLSADGVPVRLYWPGDEGPYPVLIWIHGGGWVLGSVDGYDAVARDLCVQANCLVVSVDYRRAPEHPFPAAPDDVATVARWVAAGIGARGGDPSRMAVAGDSAGGNLAAIVANELPQLFRLQVLIYPATDLIMSHPSIVENGEGYLLTKDAMVWFRELYLGDGDRSNPRVSPLYADDATLAAAPPAVVITGEYDPLRDEGTAYAARLSAAGVSVEHQRYDGMIHAFYPMRGMIPAASQALEQVSTALTKAWG